ncbi:GyrI-like domain-containing protein [Jiulongibacter sp. NS-SX5]|uniref:GyrI-like domain-containing protein n=1 Tax=Jiulongibacter sp. NS-SX5 TaxID=3463854 RepID=UPI004059A5D1
MKIDLKKTDGKYYTAKTTPEIVELPETSYLSIRGKGDPSGKDFAENISRLYPIAYTIKFELKTRGQDFIVPPLEGLWWFDETRYSGYTMDEAPQKIPRAEWEYQLQIRMPKVVNESDFKKAKSAVKRKKPTLDFDSVCWTTANEGLCVQIMHIGPFENEPESLKQILSFCEAHKLQKNGVHHEIYLSDFRKTAPEKLRTILREPVKYSTNK